MANLTKNRDNVLLHMQAIIEVEKEGGKEQEKIIVELLVAW